MCETMKMSKVMYLLWRYIRSQGTSSHFVDSVEAVMVHDTDIGQIKIHL